MNIRALPDLPYQPLPPASRGVAMVELKACQCRWPVNDARRGELHLFCGAVTAAGDSYCPAHKPRARGTLPGEHRQRLVRPARRIVDEKPARLPAPLGFAGGPGMTAPEPQWSVGRIGPDHVQSVRAERGVRAFKARVAAETIAERDRMQIAALERQMTLERKSRQAVLLIARLDAIRARSMANDLWLEVACARRFGLAALCDPQAPFETRFSAALAFAGARHGFAVLSARGMRGLITPLFGADVALALVAYFGATGGDGDPRAPARRRLPLAVIRRNVTLRACRLFGISVADLEGTSRLRVNVAARSFAAYWMYRLGSRTSDSTARVSYPMIARWFGGRDHSTIVHAVAIWPAKRGLARKLIAAARKREARLAR